MKRPLKPCSHPGCGTLVTSGKCEKHQTVDRNKVREYNRKRYADYQHLYSAEWKKARKQWLIENPFCVECEKEGKNVVATVVHHKTDHKGDVDIFWDKSRWESLCKSCHDRHTARESGGFGNKASDKPGKACGVDGVPVDSRHSWNR